MWKMKDYEKYQFSAYVDEASGRCLVFPAIKLHLTEGTKICNFTITRGDAKTMDDTLFVEISKTVSGGGQLKMRNGTHADTLRQIDGFQLFVEAKDCGIPPETSPKRPLMIYVVKSEQPHWLDAVIHIPVLRPLAAGTKLLHLTALGPDTPSTPLTGATNETASADVAVKAGGVCNYTLSSALNLNYTIDASGLLTTTRDIPYISGRTHFLSVQAATCSQPPIMSVPAIVLVTFCSPYWSEIPQILRYQPFSGGQYVFENATFENCSLQPEVWDEDNLGKPTKRTETPVGCEPDRTIAFVELLPTTESSNLACMVDPELMRTKFSTCGISVANTSWHNLLPTVIRYEDAIGRKNWPRLLAEVDDSADAPVNTYFHFDGTQHLNLTALHVLRDIGKDYLTRFSLLFWVRPSNRTSKNVIVHSTLPVGHNIDVFSVAIDGENVEVLLRWVRNAETATFKEIMLVFTASIYPDVWQHIAVVYPGEINVSEAEPSVQVFLNGRQVSRRYPTETKVETTSTTHVGQHLLVGAFWSEEKRQFSGFLKGDLAGLTLIRGKALDSAQLQCFVDCTARFSLDSGAFRGISPDTRVVWEMPFNNILIDSFDSQQVVLLLRRLRVLNLESRLASREPRTTLRLTTHITCKNSDEILHTKPTVITLAGTRSNDRGPTGDFEKEEPSTFIPFQSGNLPEANSLIKDVEHELTENGDGADEIGEVDLIDDQPCAYRLRLYSALIDSQAGRTLRVTGLGAGDGQLLVPDMELYWDANSMRCQEILKEHEINVLSCSISACLPSDTVLHLDSEQLSLHGFDQNSLQRLNISTELDNEGMGISGKASLQTYAQLLRNLGWSYSYRMPGDDMRRCFLIQCTATIQDNMNRVIAFHRSNQIAVKLELVDSPDSQYGSTFAESNDSRDLGQHLPIHAGVPSSPRPSSLKSTFQLHGGAKRNRKYNPGYWAALVILVMAFVSIITGFVWVRVQSRKRRSPAYSHKVLMRSFVAANPHCGFDEETWLRDAGSPDMQAPVPGTSRSPAKPDEKDEDGDENVWIPVRRETSPSTETLKDENLLKLATVMDRPSRQVHFILNPLLAVSKTLNAGSEWTSDESDEDESEDDEFEPSETPRSLKGTEVATGVEPALLDYDQVPLILDTPRPSPTRSGPFMGQANKKEDSLPDNFVSSTTNITPVAGFSRGATNG
ncbi:hypothetical protein AAHC03_019412 [Spirometra sp. Aus1]